MLHRMFQMNLNTQNAPENVPVLAEEYVFFSSAYKHSTGWISKHVIMNIKILKSNEVLSSNHNEMNLEINNRRKMKQSTNMWNLTHPGTTGSKKANKKIS